MRCGCRDDSPVIVLDSDSLHLDSAYDSTSAAEYSPASGPGGRPLRRAPRRWRGPASRSARPPRPAARACHPAGSPDCRPRPTPGPGKAGLRSCRSRRPARCWGAAPAPPARPPAGTAAPGWERRTRPPAPSSGRPAGAGPGAAPCTPPPCPRGRPRPGCRSPRPAWAAGRITGTASGSACSAWPTRSSCDWRKARTAERRCAGLTSTFFLAGSSFAGAAPADDRRWPVDRCGGNTPDSRRGGRRRGPVPPRRAGPGTAHAALRHPDGSTGSSVMTSLSGFVERSNDNAASQERNAKRTGKPYRRSVAYERSRDLGESTRLHPSAVSLSR